MHKLKIGEFLFDWDENKNKNNITKHNGLSFETAATIWAYPDDVLDIADHRFDYGEHRWIALGPLPQDSRLIVVVAYCDRNDVIRLISARYAEAQEEKAYHRRFSAKTQRRKDRSKMDKRRY